MIVSDETLKQIWQLLEAMWPTLKPMLVFAGGVGIMAAVMDAMKGIESHRVDDSWEPETYKPQYPRPKRHYSQPINPFKHRSSQKRVRW